MTDARNARFTVRVAEPATYSPFSGARTERYSVRVAINPSGTDPGPSPGPGGSVSSSVTDKYKAGKPSNISVADLERLDFAGAANLSVADLAAIAVGKTATQSLADRYWQKMFPGSNLSLSDKSIANASIVKAYSDTMFVAGA